MKISPISCVPRAMVRNSVQTKINETIPQPIENAGNSVSFKGRGWGGTIGSIFGTLAGVGFGAIATVATGGLAAPLLTVGLSAIAGTTAGAIGGDIIEGKLNEDKPRDDDDNERYRPDWY